ncbi:hypothetical protein [Mycolicibacterium mageritense]|nr:hypothetical protein [Mycolicibacterium mageritense]MBN3457468.1 hypothetical protein [Mycobacterium sp. DSM 3803]MCC9183571.1 hypothetical protein [Mycolicibacterium mageritense]CDO22627.1 hypothetical protein BN978_03102 [Mycolicibacterium mageritense DSM 44476 = CIP 104973]
MSAKAQRLGPVVAIFAILLTACQTTPPDRRSDVARLAQLIREIPGVLTVTSDVVNNPARGLMSFTIHVETAEDISAGQLGAVTARYLQALSMVDYTGYQTELEAHYGSNHFAIDGGALPIVNDQQIISQARGWVALRHQFPSSTINLRATIVHPEGQSQARDRGHSNIGTIHLGDGSNFTDVAAVITVLADRFAELASLTWTVNAGTPHPAEIKTSGRYPSPQELDVWRLVNADQSITHIDKMTVGGRVGAPVWIAEATRSHHPDAAAALAQRHLPLMRRIPAPVLYTSSDQIQGNIANDGRAAGPIAITVGGCTDRQEYQLSPVERDLMNIYETCGHP